MCIHGEADPDDVRKGLALLAEARRIAATFKARGIDGITAVSVRAPADL